MNAEGMHQNPNEVSFSHRMYSELTETKGESTFDHIEFVPAHFGKNPDKFKLQHLLELNADNTIVVVGDSIVYYGGELTSEEVAGTRVNATNQYFKKVEPMAVKAIVENRRVVAYATDAKKAMEYIKGHKADLVA